MVIIKKSTPILLAFVVVLTIFSLTALAAPGDTPDDPIIIRTAEQLDNMRNGLNKYYRLGNDIDLTAYLEPGGAGQAKWGDEGWLPIGTLIWNENLETYVGHFTGGFDGNGYKISGLWIWRKDSSGLFGSTRNATIANLGVEIAAAGIFVENYGYGSSGGLVGYQVGGSIINCYTTGGNIMGSSHGSAGGLVGYKEGGSIINSYATVDVWSNSVTGGLVGTQSGGIITNCYATGNVCNFVSGYDDGGNGGLVGVQYNGSITNSYAAGDVSGHSTNVGGLVGYQSTHEGGIENPSIISITNSYATGNVRGYCYGGNAGIGGLVGRQSGSSITNSYATGNVAGESGGYYDSNFGGIGGLVGTQGDFFISNNIITNCYATGNVMGNYSNIGGIVGSQSSEGTHIVLNSYRYQFSTINGLVIPAVSNDINGKHGGVKNMTELMTKTTYTSNSWLFNDSTPAAGPWYWDYRGFPKLNIRTESFPFPLFLGSGSGTQSDPYIITNAEQLDLVRNNLDKYFKLANDISLTAYLAVGGEGYSKWGESGWKPIGTELAQFTGEFEGSGHKITGLWINRGTDSVGLFGTAWNAKIANLGVEISDRGVKGYGLSFGVGGLVGVHRVDEVGTGSITNCYATGNVSIISNYIGSAGGLAGSGVNITNSYATGNVSGAATIHVIHGFLSGAVGGLVGSGGNITNSYATGNVTDNDSGFWIVGGLSGFSNSIINSYATGNVSGNSIVGGLVGWGGSITNSYATGNVTATGNNTIGRLINGFGGLMGRQEGGSITNSYATGNVTAVGHNAGGLVGSQFTSEENDNNITNCFAMGNIMSTGGNAGGLVGSQDVFSNGTNTITNSYRYQLATINGVVRTENTPSGIHGGVKTMNELLTKATYADNSWLFTDSTPLTGPWFWDGIGYPKLSFETTTTPVIRIITHPTANTTVTQGSITGSLSIVASVTPNTTLSYQWYNNITNSNTGGTLINGTTSADFAIPTGLTAGTYYYFCEVRATGATSVRSNVATVTVLPGTIPVTGLTVTPNTTTIEVGGTRTLAVNVTPVNATDRNVTWSSNNTAVATVNATGVVTAVSAGTATITARSNSNPTVMDTCVVTVTNPDGCNAMGYGHLVFVLIGIIPFILRRI